MSAQRNAGDGTSPDTAAGTPQVRVAVALPASPEPPVGALTPGRAVPAPDTTAGEAAQQERASAAPARPEAAGADAGEQATTLSGTSVAPEPDEESAAAGTAESRAEATEPNRGVPLLATDADHPGADSGESHGGRPKKPMLAAAAIVGAVLIAVPFLLMGDTSDDDSKQATANSAGHEDSDTLLGAGATHQAPDGYATRTPTAAPSKKASKKPEPSPTRSPEPQGAGGAATDAKPGTTPSATRSAKSPDKEPEPRTPVWTSTSVTAPSTLSAGESWSTNRIKMTMQTDGNLVVYNEKGKATWASMTFGAHHTARFQTDGNLVIHNGDDKPIWGADVWGHPGAKLVLRADGKVVIMDGTDVTWST
ncbi:mannose-binding protein [Streptomyces sp. Act143]|uniref:mannose-binding protein n=1 Tax=Streptomyces sp. Act143 TaxID=2200760 RepID=UPI000D67F9C6|nr:mannose-binding protein [Streptomyces sp. Act143]PWI13046.1 mannose-binding protein [Streptomyces sp. Act143]